MDLLFYRERVSSSAFNLPNLDDNTWSEFRQRMASISVQIKWTLCCFLPWYHSSVLTALSFFFPCHATSSFRAIKCVFLCLIHFHCLSDQREVQAE